MPGDLIVPVGYLLGSPGKTRPFAGEVPVHLRLGETTVDGKLTVNGVVHGLPEAVRASFQASSIAHFVCTRCLKEWDGPISATAEQYFGLIPDEDGYAIRDGAIDVSPTAIDELALALPPAPTCKPDCLGLCPTCGSDLNSDPCDGHEADTDSPFSVLKDLFDS